MLRVVGFYLSKVLLEGLLSEVGQELLEFFDSFIKLRIARIVPYST